MHRILIACVLLLIIVGTACGQVMTDYEAVNNLIVSERIYRVSHRNKELSDCYAEDARIRTSWQSGGVNIFVGRSAGEA